MIVVNLNACDGIGLAMIVAAPSGVHYNVQAGGTGCFQRTFEGVYVPLHDWNTDDEPAFDDVRDRYGLSVAQAEQLRRFCYEANVPFRPSLDPGDLEKSMEAWVLGTAVNRDDWCVVPKELDGRPAVLVWDNSD